MEKVKVFLIPYAGASSYAYYPWKSLFKEGIEPVFTELAGRGIRSGESFYSDILSAASDISDFVIRETVNCEYILFGHSMGGLIAYETYQQLVLKGWKKPKHIFISGQRPPHMISSDIYVPGLSDDEFLEIVSKFGGLPEEFFEEDIMNAFLPVLRSDFTLLSEYRLNKKNEKVKCPLSILYGSEDANVRENEIAHCPPPHARTLSRAQPRRAG